MSEAQLHANPTIRKFQTAGTGRRLATAAVKDCLIPACRWPVTTAELEQITTASKGRKKGSGHA